MKPKRLAAFGGSFIIEMIPVVGDILPTWTAAIVYLALDYKAKKALAVMPGGQFTAAMISKSRDMKIKTKNDEASRQFHKNNAELQSKRKSSPKGQGPNKSSSISLNNTNPRNQAPYNAQPSIDIRKPEQKAGEIPKNSQNNNQPYKGYQPKPDWMRDKSVQKSIDLRNQRLAVAKEMGYDQEKTSRLVLEAEKRDFDMRRGGQSPARKETTEFLTALDDNNRKLNQQNDKAA